MFSGPLDALAPHMTYRSVDAACCPLDGEMKVGFDILDNKVAPFGKVELYFAALEHPPHKDQC